jgi:hypothetical protein
LLEYYEDHEGDISNILESIICSENGDLERFVKFYEEKIKEGVIEKSKAFDKSKKNVVLLPDEKVDAKKAKK